MHVVSLLLLYFSIRFHAAQHFFRLIACSALISSSIWAKIENHSGFSFPHAKFNRFHRRNREIWEDFFSNLYFNSRDAPSLSGWWLLLCDYHYVLDLANFWSFHRHHNQMMDWAIVTAIRRFRRSVFDIEPYNCWFQSVDAKRQKKNKQQRQKLIQSRNSRVEIVKTTFTSVDFTWKSFTLN